MTDPVDDGLFAKMLASLDREPKPEIPILPLRHVCPELFAEAQRMRMALQMIRQWDMLNPPEGAEEPLADGPWLRALIDAALEDT